MKDKLERLEHYYSCRRQQCDMLLCAMYERPGSDWQYTCLFIWAEAMHEADEIGRELGIYTGWDTEKAVTLLRQARGRA